MKILILLITFLTSITAHAFDSRIAIVYIDQKTEDKLGTFPINRTFYGDAIETLNEYYHSNFIVIKIFLDIPKPEDIKLIKTLSKYSNIYSQAFATDEKKSCDANLNLKEVRGSSDLLHNFNCGWIPNKEMAGALKNIGTVNGILDQNNFMTSFSLINSINGKIYPSLPLLIASHVTSQKISISDKYINLGKKKLTFEKEAKYSIEDIPQKSPYPTYSFLDLIQKKIAVPNLEDKIVFIFYNGKKLTPIKISKNKAVNQAEIVSWVTDKLINL